MKKIEIDSSENFICPFCSNIIMDVSKTSDEMDESDESDISPCEHTFFVATELSLEYRSDLFNELFDLDPELDNSDLGIDEMYENEHFEQLITQKPLIDLVVIESYEPAPSFFGFYIGFLPEQN